MLIASRATREHRDPARERARDHQPVWWCPIYLGTRSTSLRCQGRYLSWAKSAKLRIWLTRPVPSPAHYTCSETLRIRGLPTLREGQVTHIWTLPTGSLRLLGTCVSYYSHSCEWSRGIKWVVIFCGLTTILDRFLSKSVTCTLPCPSCSLLTLLFLRSYYISEFACWCLGASF